MTFVNAIKTCLQKSFTFQGRASRSEYWYWVLFEVLLEVPFYLVLFATDLNDLSTWTILFCVYQLCVFPASTSAYVRRMHDINQSGWFFWCKLFPVVGWLIYINYAMEPSYDGDNKYGPKS